MQPIEAYSAVRRPLVGLALSVTSGMVLGASGLISTAGMLLASFLMLLTAGCFLKKPVANAAIFAAAALLCGEHFRLNEPGFSVRSIDRLADRLFEKHIHVEGKVSGVPEFYAYNRDAGGVWRFVLRCEGLCISNVWRRIGGEVDIRVPAALPGEQLIQPGWHVRVEGTARKKLFPGKNMLEVHAAGETAVKSIPGGSKVFLTWAQRIRTIGSRRLEDGMEPYPVQLSVLKALVLGMREQMPYEITEIFRRSGTFHIFAISGLHVGIVGVLLVNALTALGLSRDRFWLFLLPALAIYVVSTGMKSSALRALSMAAVFMFSPMCRRKPDIPVSIAFAAIVLLLFNPREILSAGFIFSFTVVAFIVMVYSVVPLKWLQGRVRNLGGSLVITSLAAFLASAPLSALFFGRFSPIALAGNLMVVPLTFGIVLCGGFSIILPGCSSVFNHASLLFINLLLGSSRWLDSFSWSSWPVEVPPLTAVLLWFGSLIYLFVHAASPGQRGLGLLGAGCAIALALLD